VTEELAEAVPTGNTYDKYGSKNPAVKRLMAGFQRALDELWSETAPASALDVGCGEGVLTETWADRLGDQGHVVGVDLEAHALREQWSRRSRPNLEFRTFEGGELPFERGSFDLVCAIEVLEHVPDPSLTLAEMVRVSRSHVLVSVPREPLWRALNMARGAYVRDWGNTPGHVNHWSKGAFLDLVNRHGRIQAVRSPFPWTMVLVRVA
jgi:2-polyprenyl-3-methyl-5-hydroxy-6-metoxy-1,4-benzoquinol methylase